MDHDKSEKLNLSSTHRLNTVLRMHRENNRLPRHAEPIISTSQSLSSRIILTTY